MAAVPTQRLLPAAAEGEAPSLNVAKPKRSVSVFVRSPGSEAAAKAGNLNRLQTTVAPAPLHRSVSAGIENVSWAPTALISKDDFEQVFMKMGQYGSELPQKDALDIQSRQDFVEYGKEVDLYGEGGEEGGAVQEDSLKASQPESETCFSCGRRMAEAVVLRCRHDLCLVCASREITELKQLKPKDDLPPNLCKEYLKRIIKCRICKTPTQLLPQTLAVLGRAKMIVDESLPLEEILRHDEPGMTQTIEGRPHLLARVVEAHDTDLYAMPTSTFAATSRALPVCPPSAAVTPAAAACRGAAAEEALAMDGGKPRNRSLERPPHIVPPRFCSTPHWPRVGAPGELVNGIRRRTSSVTPTEELVRRRCDVCTDISAEVICRTCSKFFCLPCCKVAHDKVAAARKEEGGSSERDDPRKHIIHTLRAFPHGVVPPTLAEAGEGTAMAVPMRLRRRRSKKRSMSLADARRESALRAAERSEGGRALTFSGGGGSSRSGELLEETDSTLPGRSRRRSTAAQTDEEWTEEEEEDDEGEFIEADDDASTATRGGMLRVPGRKEEEVRFMTMRSLEDLRNIGISAKQHRDVYSLEKPVVVDYRCPNHPKEPVHYFCNDCKTECICGSCCLTGVHGGHDVSTCEDAWETQSLTVLSELGSKLASLKADTLMVESMLHDRREGHMASVEAAKLKLDTATQKIIDDMQKAEDAMKENCRIAQMKVLDQCATMVEELSTNLLPKVHLARHTLRVEEMGVDDAAVVLWHAEHFPAVRDELLRDELRVEYQAMCGRNRDELQNVIESSFTRLAAVRQITAMVNEIEGVFEMAGMRRFMSQTSLEGGPDASSAEQDMGERSHCSEPSQEAVEDRKVSFSTQVRETAAEKGSNDAARRFSAKTASTAADSTDQQRRTASGLPQWPPAEGDASRTPETQKVSPGLPKWPPLQADKESGGAVPKGGLPKWPPPSAAGTTAAPKKAGGLPQWPPKSVKEEAKQAFV